MLDQKSVRETGRFLRFRVCEIPARGFAAKRLPALRTQKELLVICTICTFQGLKRTIRLGEKRLFAATAPMSSFEAFDAQMGISPSYDLCEYTKRHRGCLGSDIH
ncbi:hypothetical protein NBRC116601_31290 [Cognatishimia sp. WU-CL00825]